MQAHRKRLPLSPLQLGDPVLIDEDPGCIIAVRYGLVAYDVIIRDLIHRNAAPERVRLPSSNDDLHAVRSEPIAVFFD